VYWDDKLYEPLNKITHFRTKQFDEPDDAI
jgi:hypothetical protein